MLRARFGSHKGKKLAAASSVTRPTHERARLALYNILRARYNRPFENLLDAFAGSGTVSFEILAQNLAKRATLLDTSEAATAAIRTNAKNLEINDCLKIIAASALTFKSIEKFDLVFLDPPYNSNLLLPALENLAEQNLLEDGALVICELDKKSGELALPASFAEIDTRTYGRTKFIFTRYLK